MPRQNEIFAAMNRGEVSLLALARTDVEHLRLSAQSQINYVPRIVGPMTFRPGTEFIGEILGDNPAFMMRFVAAFADTALIELTAGNMRVWVDDALVTRNAVATTIPAFNTWTTVATGTAVATATPTTMEFVGMNSGATCTATTALTIASGDQATEHAIRLVIANGPINFQIGTVSGIGDIFGVETLDTGTYSLTFTPGAGNATIYMQFAAIALPDNANTTTQSIPTWAQSVEVGSLAIEAAGVMILPSPWGSDVILPPASGPSRITFDSSGDVIYVAAVGYPQYQINRYSPTAWSIVKYRPVKGPLNVVPKNASTTLTPSAYFGNINLIASANLFDLDDVGTLYRLFSTSQSFVETISFDGTFTDAIEVIGVSYNSVVGGGGTILNVATPDRTFHFTTIGTWSGTLSLERSFTSATTGFVQYLTYTSNQATTAIDDGLNNETVWYRFGFNPGDYVSGAVVVEVFYAGGGNYGVCHVTGYTSPTEVQAEVLVEFWGVTATSDWLQSQWSADQGYPTSVALHGGRLWWAGADRWWGSVSDDFTNFDFDAIGDSAPINASIGAGPISNISWLVSIDNLLAGADTSVISAISDAIQDPLTPSNFNLRRSVTNGSFPIQAQPIDQRVVYIDQSGARLYDLVYDIRIYNYKPTDLTRLNREIGLPGFVSMSVQRQPDTRINLVRTDGILISFVYDIDDDVQAFWRMQTPNGNIEFVTQLPGVKEDQVYFTIQRTINGRMVRYLEKWARLDEVVGGPINKNVDCHLVYQGAATNVLSGFSYAIGQTVTIWGQPATVGALPGNLGTAVVSGTGTVTIPNGVQVTSAVIGLGYQAEFISAKLAYAAQMGSAINRVKRVDHIGMVLTQTHCQGVSYGQWFPNDPTNVPSGIFTPPAVLDPMPAVEDGAEVPENTLWLQYDNKQFEFPSELNADLRIYLQSQSPNPATINGITFSIETSG